MGVAYMGKRVTGLERLYFIYNKLSKSEKEKIIRLAEGLLNSKNIINKGKKNFEEENIEEADKFKYLPLILPTGTIVYKSKPVKPKK